MDKWVLIVGGIAAIGALFVLVPQVNPFAIVQKNQVTAQILPGYQAPIFVGGSSNLDTRSNNVF